MPTEHDLTKTLLDYLRTRLRGGVAFVKEHALHEYVHDKGFRWTFLRTRGDEVVRVSVPELLDELAAKGCVEVGERGRAWKWLADLPVLA